MLTPGQAMAEELATERGRLPPGDDDDENYDDDDDNNNDDDDDDPGSVKTDLGFQIFRAKAEKRPKEFGEK